MNSFERMEQRLKEQGVRSPRRSPAPRQPAARQVAERSQHPTPMNVILEERSFGGWVTAGFGIGVGMFLFSLVLSIPVLLFSMCGGAATLPAFP